MESIGSSLPSMPEPANPVSMKQEPLGVCKGGGDVMNSDPSTLLLDKAAAHLAATLQLNDGVLQKMSGHNNNHNHERLKDLTSRVLNGDQDAALPKPCVPELPILKGAEAPAANGTHHHPHQCVNGTHQHPEPELQASVPKVLQEPTFEPRSAKNGTILDTEDMINKEDEIKKRRGRPTKPKPQPQQNLPPSAPEITIETLGQTQTLDGPDKEPELIIPPLTEEKVAEDSSLFVCFSVGSLVWTKVSGYPWWPCMVTTDPECNSHFKQKPKAVNSRLGLLYHVQYFGDAPERGYIWEKNMVVFSGEEQYNQLSQSSKQPAARLPHKKTSPSVPRKLQAQWNMGLLQAKEALAMSADDRLATFTFLYDHDGPHLNPQLLDKLKPEPGMMTQETASRLIPQPPTVLPVTPDDKDDLTATQPQPQSSTSKKEKKTRAPRTKLKPGETRRKRGTAAQKDSLSQSKKKGKGSAKETAQTQLDSQDPSALAPDADLDSIAPPPLQKKKRKPRQLKQTQPAATKTVRRRKKAAAAEHTSEPVKKRKPKVATSTDDVSDPASLPVSVPVKRQRKKAEKRPLADAAAEKGQQPKRRRKANKDAEKQGLTSEGTEKKQRRRRKKTDTEETETTKQGKKSKALLTAEAAAEKPKRRRKRKQDGENQNTAAKAKKRRLSPCPEPEGSGSEGRPESPSDSLDGTKKGERKKEFVCQTCEQAGEDLVPCEGQCCGMFHLQCLGASLKPDDKLLCPECSSGVHSCFQCKQSEGVVRRCYVQHCGRFYHEACVSLNPLTVLDNKGFRCPLHACLSCHYSQAKHKTTKVGRLMRCLRCPVAYHTGDLCVAAGSEMITNTAFLCTNHFKSKKGYSHHSHVNVSWCFVCSKGGQLLCCESCPAAFHPDCLNIAMPDGSWFCNDCRAGKKPRYRDIIWVKLGTYRWWPAEIHHPRNIPTNIQHLRHEIGEFPVFFFGSKDYFWTHQGRVFPYMEGDRGSKYQRTSIGKVFKNALLEAESRFKEIKIKREAKEAQENSKKPPPYKFIKVNKPFGKVQVYTADISEIPKCNCKPSDERPCGFSSECLNRMLQYECHPGVCPSGERCCNQDFTQRRYPDTKIIKTPGKGWGLVALRDIKKGEFVNEYIGELIDEEECRARIRYAQENNMSDFYMLTIDKDRIIDAGPKGNYSRFMNHSCQPNNETQKWTVNGDTRVGLFAVCDIPAGTELTFNYNLDCLGNEKTVCRCGAPNCSGFLGDRPKNSSGQPAEPKAKKRKYKKRKSEGKKKSEDDCFRCGDGGQLVLCGKKTCTKAYHLSCLNLTKRPFGRWDCPWHHCDVCGKTSESFCDLCPNSFCKAHGDGALRSWAATGQKCCAEHDEADAAPTALEGKTSSSSSSSLKGPEGKSSTLKGPEGKSSTLKNPEGKSATPKSPEGKGSTPKVPKAIKEPKTKAPKKTSAPKTKGSKRKAAEA